MSNTDLFEISGDDIALLGDADLRDLIGMLCEADYRSEELSVKGIRYGGHQDAKDGGIDVIIDGNSPPPKNGFVSRALSGFQVKKPNMTASHIKNEMKPDGVLRPRIKNLIKNKGAYLIVSSGSSVTEEPRDKLLEAMKGAVANEENHKDLHLDFLDRDQIATWVRSHPTMILWVRNRIGRELQGWQPYDNWAKAPDGIEEEYILDNKLRLFDKTRPKDDVISVEEGLSRLRQKLSTPGVSIRLVGLSGTGKTRLVQALFDERIGNNALNPSLVFYTDISDEPRPTPRKFAKQLSAMAKQAVIIVDNCTPELHRKLTEVCSKAASISLLTVEYDVKEDIPDETNVFKLQTASTNVIEKIILKRFPDIKRPDAGVISEFSGGNARVAIALANTLKMGETLSGLKDEHLFKRLFRQRNDPNDESLLKSAEVCSLLYSFEGTDTSTENSELNILASLISKSGDEIFRDVNKLKDRDLVQSRGKWRAVLPLAIANKLAGMALESIAKDRLVNTILNSGSERLIKSFTRRLKYLHDCDIAIEISKEWLSSEGWIGKSILELNEFDISILKNIAPVCPEKTLEIIEKAANDLDKGAWFTSQENPGYDEFIKLLRHLAYDQETFYRSAKLISRFVLSEKGENNSSQDCLKSLFYIYLSGTYATIEDRKNFINEFLNSKDEKSQKLALSLLDAALEAWHFSSSYEFSFGARPRDYGWQPKIQKEYLLWFETFINICTQHALTDKPTASEAKKILADKMRGLWTKAKAYKALENSVESIRKNQSWNEGWIAVGGILKYDSKKFSENVLNRLYNLRKKLKPEDLENLARTYTLLEKHFSYDLEDNFENDEKSSEDYAGAEKKTREIASLVAQNDIVLMKLLPDLVSARCERLRAFGQGLAEGCDNKKALWKRMYDQILKTPEYKRNINLLLGFMSYCSESDPDIYNSILDGIIDDDVLGKMFPLFQITSKIDKRGMERLHKSLDTGKGEIKSFVNIAYGRSHESISDDDLSELLEKFLKRKGGYFVVSEILKMRFHRKDANTLYSDNLMQTARKTLTACPFSREYEEYVGLSDHSLSQIAKECLSQDGCEAEIRKVYDHVYNSIVEDCTLDFKLPNFLNILAKNQPRIFLDSFLGNKKISNFKKSRMFSFDFEQGNNPFNNISDEVLLSWCEEDPENRYPIISASIKLFAKSKKTGNLIWRPIINSVFEKTHDMKVILENLASSIYPSSYMGSLADVLQSRLVLFEEFQDHENEEIRSWAKSQLSNFKRKIESRREQEDKRNREEREEDESFE